MTRYFVKSGDTLSKIATKFQLTLDDMLQANLQIHDPDKIFPGQALNIPSEMIEHPVGVDEHHFDGVHPAPGCSDTNRAAFSHPPLTNQPGDRKQHGVTR
jgi:LysM repeat protein